MKTLCLLPLLSFVLLTLPSRGALPSTLTHQGRLTVDGVNYSGSGGLKFMIYEAPAAGDPTAIARWKNNAKNPANTSQPPIAVPVTVAQGLYSIALGDNSLLNMAALPTSLAPNLPGNQLYLRIWFNDGTHGYQQLSPDQELRAVVFARHAEDAKTAATATSALSVPPGTIDSSMLANNSVTADKIADNSISEDQLEAEGVAASLSSLGAAIVSQDPNAAQLLSAGYIRLGEISQPAWETISPGVEPPTARSGHSMVWTGTRVIMWGGLDASLNRLNDGYTFDFATNQWSPISLVGAPSPRLEHTAVWTGTHMLVWGGLEVTDELEDGASYDPATDTWSSLSAAPAALGKRAKHKAVWTGTHMIIHGGLDLDFMAGHTYYDNAAAYNPANGNWNMLTSINAPLERERHTMIWTGSKVIVWGGSNGTNFSIDDGGIYDPANNTWTTLPAGTLDAPDGRASHSGVWTGSEMVIWGGFVNGTGHVTNGAAYDPATASWRTLATPPVGHTGREGHTATWTGSEMVIVGGKGTFPNQWPTTASAYDPAADNWRTLPTADSRIEFSSAWNGSKLLVFGGKDITGTIASSQFWIGASNLWFDVAAALAPTPRISHTVEWTGSKLLVWGGLDDSFGAYVNSGGIFDPSTGGWSDLPTAAAPPGLSNPAHCWSGSEMIVWGGGQAGDSTSAAGGRYNPGTESWASITSTGAPTGRSFHTGVSHYTMKKESKNGRLSQRIKPLSS